VSEAIAILWFPAVVAAALLLAWRWSIAMRRLSLCLAYAVGATLLCIAITGLGHSSRPTATAHQWLSHGLLIFAWNAIPLAIGVTLVGARARPVAASVRSVGLLLLLGVLFVATFTGYLRPSHGPIDAMSLNRFRLLHYGGCPSLSFALVVGWYYGLEADVGPRSRDRGQFPAEG
jgi:hypothetical protein